ncbi:Rrf2 family transcriptional regulator [Wenzhouxiangella sp. AB-CW3]|uniref:RrF2 family transcriptional regulator n=1 Tax=Wenzhouxiangella sp. AB-CW3 TaxID=2771012 RepID=UPI00168A6FF4|nr:Rrf2 family transcriptional regulator [Wenzhouxiangella sp. AB-CW3]QOC22943.1 Rrf2 family transcriptional regulator [Wenzhouxiangella sp. AB-CW3]
MRLTLHTDLALRVLIYLALIRPERATIQQIAETYGISRNHLMKVVHQLVTLGYVRSTRGAGGGIELARDPGNIRIGQLVSRVESDFRLVECFRPDNACVITPVCRLPGMLDEALTRFRETLDQYTLADLTRPRDQAGLKLHLRL